MMSAPWWIIRDFNPCSPASCDADMTRSRSSGLQTRVTAFTHGPSFLIAQLGRSFHVSMFLNASPLFGRRFDHSKWSSIPFRLSYRTMVGRQGIEPRSCLLPPRCQRTFSWSVGDRTHFARRSFKRCSLRWRSVKDRTLLADVLANTASLHGGPVKIELLGRRSCEHLPGPFLRPIQESDLLRTALGRRYPTTGSMGHIVQPVIAIRGWLNSFIASGTSLT